MPPSPLEFCPVPSEQQPIHEYEQLKESWFFSWPALAIRQYRNKLLWIAFWAWLPIAPIAGSSFPPAKYAPRFLLSSTLSVAVILALVVLRLYLGWLYIGDRLKSERIFYEESGWYDGQIWTKTPEILNRDRLIVEYKIKPILERLKQTGLFLGLIITITSLIWFFLSFTTKYTH
jgi:hypothetical protein